MGTCNQKNCTNAGTFRFTWPGEDEKEICSEHVGKLRAIANAMGLHLQILPAPGVELPAYNGTVKP